MIRPIMKSDNELLVNREGPICTITINRPEKLNALSPNCLIKMSKILNELSEDAKVRSVVICGAGSKSFSSGYDIEALSVSETIKTNKSRPIDLAIQSILAFPYPIIAMINGYAYGAGCTIALSCDIRVASRNARIGMQNAKRGLVPSLDELSLFIRIIGFSRTLEIFQTGRTYDSQQCLEMNLVNYVVDNDKLKSFTYDLAKELSENAPLALRGTKIILNEIRYYPILPEEIVNKAQSLRVAANNSEDKEESIRAFREKRKPRFKGR